MPDRMTQNSIELRTEIARSRCRLDRHLFQWTDDTLWFKVARDVIRSRPARRWPLVLGAAYFVARWIGETTAGGRENSGWSTAWISAPLDRLGRYLRLVARKTRRHSHHSDSESSDE